MESLALKSGINLMMLIVPQEVINKATGFITIMETCDTGQKAHGVKQSCTSFPEVVLKGRVCCQQEGNETK